MNKCEWCPYESESLIKINDKFLCIKDCSRYLDEQKQFEGLNRDIENGIRGRLRNDIIEFFLYCPVKELNKWNAHPRLIDYIIDESGLDEKLLTYFICYKMNDILSNEEKIKLERFVNALYKIYRTEKQDKE